MASGGAGRWAARHRSERQREPEASGLRDDPPLGLLGPGVAVQAPVYDRMHGLPEEGTTHRSEVHLRDGLRRRGPCLGGVLTTVAWRPAGRRWRRRRGTLRGIRLPVALGRRPPRGGARGGRCRRRPRRWASTGRGSGATRRVRKAATPRSTAQATRGMSSATGDRVRVRRTLTSTPLARQYQRHLHRDGSAPHAPIAFERFDRTRYPGEALALSLRSPRLARPG